MCSSDLTAIWRLLPSLPLSVGLGPICSPPGGWPRSHHRCSHGSSQSHRIHAIARSTPDTGAPTRLRSARPVVDASTPWRYRNPSVAASSHGMPVCSTNRIPSDAARSSTRGRPPFGKRGRSGSNGSSVSHNSLLIRCFVISLQTYTPPFRTTGFVSDS